MPSSARSPARSGNGPYSILRALAHQNDKGVFFRLVAKASMFNFEFFHQVVEGGAAYFEFFGCFGYVALIPEQCFFD